MTGLGELLRRRMRRVREGAEAGFSMIEMVVGMAIMGIFMAIFTGALISMFSAANSSQALSNSSQQLNVAFQQLDKLVRYASYIAVPGQGTDGNWYVEIELTAQPPSMCYQLRVNKTADQLQMRNWNVTAGGAPTSWSPLASYVTNGGAAPGASQPFVLTVANATVTSEQLGFNLTAADGNGSGNTASTSTNVTFTALNTSQKTPTSGTCTGERP